MYNPKQRSDSNMSKENPGIIFDASNSWNGFNHQGKLVVLVFDNDYGLTDKGNLSII
ncbi:MAG: hypothetical protein K6B41_08885 [Butyrivibrio sp.]|nr:hypothetical protein [Butyrivibrio sp.]